MRLLARVPRAVWAVLAVAYAVAIFAVSQVPGDQLPGQGAFWDWLFNFLHLPMYFGLGFLCALATRSRIPSHPGRSRALAAVALAFGYSVFDEFHQSFVRNRDSDPVDLVTDLCGICAAVLVARMLTGRASDAPAAPAQAWHWKPAAALLGLGAVSALFASHLIPWR